MRYGCYAANDQPDMCMAVAVQGEESAGHLLEHLHLKSPSAPQEQASEYSDGGEPNAAINAIDEKDHAINAIDEMPLMPSTRKIMFSDARWSPGSHKTPNGNFWVTVRMCSSTRTLLRRPRPSPPAGRNKCLLPESVRPKAERQQVLAEAELALAE